MNAPDLVNDAATAALAERLLARSGRGRLRALERLTGGRNNRVYRVELAGGGAVALKCYFNDPRDPRDRLAAEWNFLDFAWRAGVRNLPQPLARDDDAHAALYGFVVGRRLTADEVTEAHIEAAADFIAAIKNGTAPAFPLASEACLSLADHLAIVERRLERLAALDPMAPRVDAARALIEGRLREVWKTAQANFGARARAAGIDPARRLDPTQGRLSPSDFGFHNALVDAAGKLVFLDFEYAGMDDPAKLVVDFFCQPEVPVPARLRPWFRDQLVARGVLDLAAVARSEILFDVCRVKWACIMLNDFLPIGDARRAFADSDARDARCATQLAKVEAAIEEIAA